MDAVEDLLVPSLDCSALSAEQERMDGQEWNVLSRIILPL
jgi:hypothetical protein